MIIFSLVITLNNQFILNINKKLISIKKVFIDSGKIKMLKNTIFSTNHVIRLHSLNQLSLETNNKTTKFELPKHTLQSFPNLTFTTKYSFFRHEVTVDYKKNYYEILQVSESATLI